MAPPSATPVPLRRAATPGRPSPDPACAGCPQLGALRALRRAGLALAGRAGCEPGDDPPLVAPAPRWAALVGARRVLADPGAVLAALAGAQVLVLADRDGPSARAASELLARAGLPQPPLDGADPARAEAAVGAAPRGAVLVALASCPRGTPRRPPLAVDARRCNRCGACLSLACAAISDAGGEAMTVDPAVCRGCGACARLCRSGALAAPSPP